MSENLTNEECAREKRFCFNIVILAKSFLCTLIVFAIFCLRAEHTHVFFIHGANVSEQDARGWASEMFKRLWQTGANIEFHMVSWDSNIGPSYNYQVNVSNAFVAASRVAPLINSATGRKVIIAHSLGTVVGASAIQDYGVQVDKFIMLNSAIPSEAFHPSLANESNQNHLVHNEWADYPNSCWTANWYKLFSLNDSRSKLTWRGRFENVASLVVNFYSSGDEVLEIYERAHNPAWYNGFSPSGNWGERYSWHKQELYKGRKWWLGFIGTTYWSGWGFKENALGFKVWSAEDANAVTDVSIFKTNMVFNPYPISITNSVQSRVEIDSHLAQGIPSLSPPAGRIDLSHIGIQSFDMNSSVFMSIPYARSGNGDLDNRFLHSDIKNVAYMFNYKVFMKIVDVGGLR